jgi:hypothetical protein
MTTQRPTFTTQFTTTSPQKTPRLCTTFLKTTLKNNRKFTVFPPATTPGFFSKN